MFDRFAERYAPLSDLRVRAEGDGRLVEAYASVFGVRQEIRDREGHYYEEIHPQAFDKSLAQRADRLQFMFNHGMTMHGTPSERFSMPIGTPVEMRADAQGLYTLSRVAKTELGDEVLELIEAGAIRGYSFSGAFLGTEDTKPATRSELGVKVRTEIALREYGPTPFPAYSDARIAGVRSEAAEMFQVLTVDEIAEHLGSLSDEARSDLLRALADPAVTDPGIGTDLPPATRTDVVAKQKHLALRARQVFTPLPKD